ncbi:MAG: hypothetical protein Q4C87_05535 [Actinomycetaceae bacterium]|nr:hypothetical protein [Actinomycetaceae bacterium]
MSSAAIARTQPSWWSLVWARAKTIPMALFILMVSLPLPLLIAIIGPSYSTRAAPEVITNISLISMMFGLGTALFTSSTHGGSLPAQVTSGGSRQRIEATSWVTEIILSLFSVAAWVGIHVITPLFPWPILLSTSAHPAELILLATTVFFGGACGRLSGAIMRRFSPPLSGLLSLFTFIPFSVGNTAMIFRENGTNIYMTLGIPLWVQIVPALVFMGIAHWIGMRTEIRPIQR